MAGVVPCPCSVASVSAYHGAVLESVAAHSTRPHVVCGQARREPNTTAPGGAVSAPAALSCAGPSEYPPAASDAGQGCHEPQYKTGMQDMAKHADATDLLLPTAIARIGARTTLGARAAALASGRLEAQCRLGREICRERAFFVHSNYSGLLVPGPAYSEGTDLTCSL